MHLVFFSYWGAVVDLTVLWLHTYILNALKEQSFQLVFIISFANYFFYLCIYAHIVLHMNEMEMQMDTA